MLTKTKNSSLIFGEFIAIKKENKIVLKTFSFNNAIMQQEKLRKIGFITQLTTYNPIKETNKRKFRYIIKIQQYGQLNK